MFGVATLPQGRYTVHTSLKRTRNHRITHIMTTNGRTLRETGVFCSSSSWVRGQRPSDSRAADSGRPLTETAEHTLLLCNVWGYEAFALADTHTHTTPPSRCTYYQLLPFLIPLDCVIDGPGRGEGVANVYRAQGWVARATLKSQEKHSVGRVNGRTPRLLPCTR